MLILSDTTKEGALNGVNLWLFTLVPTLLPFMIISSVIMETGSYTLISSLLAPVMKHLFKLPKASGFPFIMGLLSGFPMGSKITADMVKTGVLSVLEGNILLTFCNNISPPFIISYLVSYILKINGTSVLFITAIMIISPIFTGIITARLLPLIVRKKHTSPIKSVPAVLLTGINNVTPDKSKRSLVDSCIFNSFENILKLGGYIIIFTIFCNILSIPVNKPYLYCIISGILEITSGLNSFFFMPVNTSVILSACILTAFGGLCAIAQTYAMINGSGLSLKIYIAGKFLNSAIVFCLMSIFLSLT